MSKPAENNSKAQVSMEFLLNFLAFLAVISILLGALTHLFSASKFLDSKILEKARMEEFARTLDASLAIRNDKFYINGNYSFGDVNNGGAIVREVDGEEIKGYTIYGMRTGGADAEPV